MSDIAVPDKNIWTPEGMVPPGWVEAARAVRDYDESLSLGRRDSDGEWVVCKRRAAGEYPFPVFSLGKSPEAPSREVVLEKLSQGDVRRNGARILRDVARANAKIQEEKRAAAADAADEWLEYAEFYTRGERG